MTATAIAKLAERDLALILGDIAWIVNHETPSKNKPLLDTGLAAIESWIHSRLGDPSHRERHDGGEDGDVLELRYPGTANGSVLLLGHYDTVWPEGTLEEWPVSTDGKRMSGPGVLDMKAGVVQGVWAVHALRELGLPHPEIRILLNGDEEVGSHASRPHIEAASADVDATLVLEPSRAGQVKTGRAGMGFVDVSVHGVESHAGLDPTAGASAVHALAEIVPQLTAMAAPELGTTVNVGVLDGGTQRNVIAGHARCAVDVRVKVPEEMSRVDAALGTLTVSDPRVKVVVDTEWNRPPMTPNPPSAALFGQAREVAEELGFTLGETFVGGASDANFVSALGRGVLCGLGAVGEGPHARTEYIVPKSVPTQIALVAGLLNRLGE
ncbi:M20 family metallopeptidase [Spiractinospora alimapuensis]|uniref:M20 family metallopeptidase n=1 Tax=Spiractinospora alimapuensis TaxID=2820884 RepID=UPI001F1FEB21|nr:M20 family metallopeptidase [Spiractinospora alimapuensis]QVQ50122.1 M20 family metallopeptidase [Spiractinospora alimapuensis]